MATGAQDPTSTPTSEPQALSRNAPPLSNPNSASMPELWDACTLPPLQFGLEMFITVLCLLPPSACLHTQESRLLQSSQGSSLGPCGNRRLTVGGVL